MKKLRKVLGLLIGAAMAISAGTLTCSAERKYGVPNLKKAIYINTAVIKSNGYSVKDIIDEDGKFGMLTTSSPNQIVVKMIDGQEPILEEGSGLEVKPFNKDVLTEFDKYGQYFIDIGTEDTEDLYMIYGFDNKTINAIEYCKNLLKEKKADIAKPIFYSTLCEYTPYLPDEEVKKYGFHENLYRIKLVMKDNVTAENFDMSCVTDLSENLYKKAVEDNCLLFQLNREAEGTKMAEILTALENREEVSKISIYGALLESGASIAEITSVFEKGDVNFDDEIDVFDAVNIAKYTVNTIQFNSEQKHLADLTGDDNVDVFDAIALAKKTVE